MKTEDNKPMDGFSYLKTDHFSNNQNSLTKTRKHKPVEEELKERLFSDKHSQIDRKNLSTADIIRSRVASTNNTQSNYYGNNNKLLHNKLNSSKTDNFNNTSFNGFKSTFMNTTNNNFLNSFITIIHLEQ